MVKQNHIPTFDSVTLQGTTDKEDLTELCSLLLTKTAGISFLSCQIDFKRITIAENLDRIRAVQIRGDAEIIKLSNFLDKSWGIRRLDYSGINTFDQICKFNYTQRLQQLDRLVLSTYFFSQDTLEYFLLEQLPHLSYLEMSSISLTDSMFTKCSEKF